MGTVLAANTGDFINIGSFDAGHHLIQALDQNDQLHPVKCHLVPALNVFALLSAGSAPYKIRHHALQRCTNSRMNRLILLLLMI